MNELENELEDGVWHTLAPGHIGWRTAGLWRVQISDSSSTFMMWTKIPHLSAVSRWVKQEFPKHITTLEDKKEYALAIWRLES